MLEAILLQTFPNLVTPPTSDYDCTSKTTSPLPLLAARKRNIAPKKNKQERVRTPHKRGKASNAQKTLPKQPVFSFSFLTIKEFLSRLSTKAAQAGQHLTGAKESLQTRKHDYSKNALQKLSRATTTLHTDLSAITWKPGPPTTDLQILFNAGVLGSKINLRLLKGPAKYTAILPAKRAQLLLTALPRKRVVSIIERLSEIRIRLAKKTYDTPGVLAVIGNALAQRGVNVELIISNHPDVSFFIREEALPLARAILSTLLKQDIAQAKQKPR
ncbi:hypothetical protein D6783_04220 [Candidatus Woesearchaeota archaeon]|nr:MAG: hypothetical protein D6783_04220 [Candidatus Woesearchaeota archaeon]